MGSGLSAPLQLDFYYNVDTDSIDLSAQELRKIPISAIVRQFPALQWLNVSDNKLTSVHPDIAQLQSLSTLQVAYNGLTTLPPAVAQMTALTHLDVTGNKLQVVPQGVLDMLQLVEINLCWNRFASFSLPYAGANDWCPSKITLTFNLLPTFVVQPGFRASNLLDLDLSQNLITTLPDEVRLLKNLRRLCLAHNMIKELPASLKELSQIFFLDLECNLLSDVGPVMEMESLEYLILEHNTISELPATCQLFNLREVSLTTNQIARLPAGLTGIMALLCSFNELTELPTDFRGMSELTHIDLASNKFTEIPDVEPNFSSVQLLSLANNQIERLSPTFFSTCHTIKELNLCNNKLTNFSCSNIPAYCIEYLDISGNGLEQLHDVLSFKTLFNLQLGRNRLQELPRGICTLPRLVILNISCNNISDFRRIGGMRHVQELHMGYNQPTMLFPEDMSFVIKLKELFLGGLAEVTVFPQQLQRLPKLQSLYFTNSGLAQLPQTFRPMTSICQLILSHNNIVDFPPLHEFVRLQEVNLSYNRIKHVPGDVLTQMGRSCQLLEDLDLSNNELVTVPPEVGELRSLIKLKLQYNQITGLPTELRKLFKKLICINLEGNPVTAGQLHRKVREHCALAPRTVRPTDLCVGFSEMMGSRPSQEDTMYINEDFGDGYSFYGIFDGHGGAFTAEHCCLHFHAVLRAQLTAGLAPTEALRETHRLLQSTLRKLAVTSGSTSVTVLRKGDTLWTANAGDARAIVARHPRAGVEPAHRLSFDHKPTERTELTRIRALGGHVVQGRVNQSLAVSRAFGDLDCQPFVTSDPRISTYQLTADDAFVVIGCDGVWDVFTDDQAAGVMHTEFQRHLALGTEAKRLCGACAVRLRDESFLCDSADNISVCVVPLFSSVADYIKAQPASEC